MKNSFRHLAHGLVAVVLCIVAATILTACGGMAKGADQSATTTVVREESVVMATAMNAAPRAAAKEAEVADYASSSSEGNGGISTSSTQERKLIKTGSITIEVENLASTENSISAWCAEFGGYVSASYSEESRASFTVRIPAAEFDTAMAAVGDLGKVVSRNISSRDVSEQFYDLQTRLETRKLLRDKLQSYLSNAANMKDILQIESELNDTITEIESMEGRMRRLTNQIEYSTITVEAKLPYRTTDQGFQWPEFGKGIRRFMSNVVDFFAGFVAVLLYIVIFGIPILAAAAFFYWLLLGKVGLLRKIFNKLKARKD